jgi:penicillin-binding protein-related factor A (putative recombinase)
MLNEDSRLPRKKASQSGQHLESLLINQFKIYKRNSLAYIDKNTGTSIADKLEMMYLNETFKKKLRVDFIGYTKAYMGERLDKSAFVGIEAKQSLKPYLPFSMIRPHQLDYLFNLYRKGCIAFIVIGFPYQDKIVKWWLNPDTYQLIKSTTSYDGKFTKGVDLETLIQKTGKDNVLTYKNPDLLGLRSMMAD